MGFFRQFLPSSLRRRAIGASAVATDDARRSCGFENLEHRRLLASDIHLGAVYYEDSSGQDQVGDTFTITWSGGAAGTQLTQLIIDTDKEGNGLTNGDPFFDITAGGLGAFNAFGLSIISHAGFEITGFTVTDGGTKLVINFSGFDAGEKLVFTIDVDEYGFDIDEPGDGVNAVVEGAELQGSKLTGKFTAPHYFEATGTGVFRDAFNTQLAASGLDLPDDSYAPPNANASEVYTAGAFAKITQTPLPITISGTVYEDQNLNNIQEAGDQGIAGVTLSLLVFNGSTYVDTGMTAVTDANGNYEFEGVLPGKYRIVETQPAGLFSVGATIGTVNNAPRGVVTNVDVLSEIELFGGEDSIDNDFAEAKPASLSGYVYHDADNDGVRDAGEQGIGGAVVQVIAVDVIDGPVGPISVTTDSSGFWSVTGLRPGKYRVVEVQPNGYLDGLDSAGSAGGAAVNPGDEINGISLASGQSGVEYNFGELLPGRISGRVFADLDGDFKHDPGELLLSGVTVHLLDATGAIIATTTTNANGEYEFTGLRPGVYGVLEEQPEGYFDSGDTVGSLGGTLVGPDSIREIVVGSGDVGVNYDFSELQPASLAGTVYVDSNNNGVQDPGEKGIAGVELVLLDANGQPTGKKTTTDANGDYIFVGLAPGEYQIVETQPAGYFDGIDSPGSAGGIAINPGDKIHKIVIGPNEDAVDYDFGELEPASIRGRVHADLDGDCTFDEGESPIAGVVIELLDSSGKVIATTQTDANGFYEFKGLAPGVYAVREIQPAGYFDGGETVGSAGGVKSANDVISEIELGSGVNAVDYNFCEKVPASIKGRVHADLDGDCTFDEGESPIAGVVIQLLDANGNVIATTLTDADGFYEFKDLAPGVYAVREIQPFGYFDGGETIGSAGGVLAENDLISEIVLGSGVNAIDYNFCEKVPASIRGRVHVDLNDNRFQDPGEAGIGGVVIQLLDADGNVVATTITDANGDYAFLNLKPGTYGIRELQPAGWFDAGDVVGSEGGRLADNDLILDITLSSGAAGINYNFCEIPPGTISGYVFQDGPPIEVENIQNDLPGLQQVLPQIRPGIRTPDARPLAGVRLLLADAAGQFLLDSNGQIISTVTDANGYYQFTNLPPGLYSVIQVQPDGFIDGIDTVGSLGGFAMNPGMISLSAFAIDTTDAIVGIPLGAGQTSIENNFSEVVIVERTPPPFPYIPPPPEIPELPTPAPLAPPEVAFIPPAPPIIPPVKPPLYGGSSVKGYTWHLSVVNAGLPRAKREVEDTLVQLTSSRFDAHSWTAEDMTQARWTLRTMDENGIRQIELFFGQKDAIPVTGDFNGDGVTEVGVFVAGNWFLDLNGDGIWDEDDLWAKLGSEGDLPVTGDWDGDGKTDIAIFGEAWAGDPRAVKNEPGLPDPRNYPTVAKKNMPPDPDKATTGERMMKRTAHGKIRADLIDHVFHYGTAGDIPLSGDWKGAGADTIGVYRDGAWVLDYDGDGKVSDDDLRFYFGEAGDLPVVGDWNGDGIDEVGIYRDGIFRLDTNGDRQLDESDATIHLGGPHSIPVVGDWNGDGVDEVGVFDSPSGQADPIR